MEKAKTKKEVEKGQTGKATGVGTTMLDRSTELSLNNWDIVNATTYEAVNSAISLQKKTPASFSQTGTGTSIDGTWDTWSVVTGGSGGAVQMKMPIKTGTATIAEMLSKGAVLNAPVMQPGMTGDLTLDAAKTTLTATDIGNDAGYSFGERSLTTGKAYFEVAVAAVGNGIFIGVGATAITNNKIQRDKQVVCYRTSGKVLANGNNITLKKGGNDVDGDPWSEAGSIVGMAVDFGTNEIWITDKDGNWQGDNADPGAGTGAVATLTTSTAGTEIFPFVAVFENASAEINLGTQAFKHAIPNGFQPGFKKDQSTTVDRDLAGATVMAKITLSLNDAGAKKKTLKADQQGTPTRGPVEVLSVKMASGADAVSPVLTHMGDWLNANIGNFDNIFHEVDFSAAAQPSMAWMKAKKASYAVADATSLTSKNKGVFAVLVQTDKSTVADNKLADQVSPNLLDNIGTDENAIVAISAERVTEQILLEGAKGVAAGNEDPNFVIDDDKRVVSNKNAFKMPLAKLEGLNQALQPIVPVGGFKMEIIGRRIKVAYSGLTLDLDAAKGPDGFSYKFGFEQEMFLVLEKLNNGHHHLKTTFQDPKDPNTKLKPKYVKWDNVLKHWHIDLVPNSNAKGGLSIAGILSIIGGALGLILLGVGVVYGVYRCVASGATEVAADDAATEMALKGESSVDGDQVTSQQRTHEYGSASQILNGGVYGPAPAFENVCEKVDAVFNLNAQIDADGLESNLAAAKKAKPLPSRSMLCYALAGVQFAGLRTTAHVASGQSLGLTTTQLEDMNKGDMGTLPLSSTVEAFLDKTLSQFDWPKTQGFELKSSTMNGALMLRGKFVGNTIRVRELERF